MVMVRCNIMDVLQALSAFIKVTIMKLAGCTCSSRCQEDGARCDGSSLTLRYFDFSSCFSIFAPKLDHLRCQRSS